MVVALSQDGTLTLERGSHNYEARQNSAKKNEFLVLKHS